MPCPPHTLACLLSQATAAAAAATCSSLINFKQLGRLSFAAPGASATASQRQVHGGLVRLGIGFDAEKQ